MKLQEPIVEFIPIELDVFTTSCPDGTLTGSGSAGGGQRCIASQIDAHPCDDWDSDVPWIDD